MVCSVSLEHSSTRISIHNDILQLYQQEQLGESAQLSSTHHDREGYRLRLLLHFLLLQQLFMLYNYVGTVLGGGKDW